MPDVIQLGGLALNGMLLTAIIAAFAGYGALWLWTMRARGRRSGPWGDMVTGSVAVAVAVWKFGVLFREPSLLWEQPQLLLVISGSGAEAAAGLAVAGVVWVWLARRNGIGLLKSLDALAVAAAGGLLVWNALSAFEYRWGYAAVCAVLLALLIGRRAPEASPADGSAAVDAGGETRGSAVAAANVSAPEAAGSPGMSANGGDVADTKDAAPGMADQGGPGRKSPDGGAAVLAGYVLGAGCLAVSLFAVPPPWVRPPMLAGLTGTQLLFIAVGLAAAALDAYKGRSG